MSEPEHIWAYCDSCRDTRPVNGTEVRDYLSNGTAHSYVDLVCSVCYNAIATISIGLPDGSPPVDPPLHRPPPEPTAAPEGEETDGPLRRVHEVELRRDGERIQARVAELHGTGDRLPDALRELAEVIEHSDLTIWVPLAAKTYSEDGQLKARCPECGHVTTFANFDSVIAYVCEGCGFGINVEP